EVAERLRALLPRLQEAPAEFAASTPKNNSRYLARALLWIRLRQNAAQWAWAAAGLIVAGSTGAGVYHGMTASSAASQQRASEAEVSSVTPNGSEPAAPVPSSRQPAVASVINPLTPAPGGALADTDVARAATLPASVQSAQVQGALLQSAQEQGALEQGAQLAASAAVRAPATKANKKRSSDSAQSRASVAARSAGGAPK